MGGRQGYQTRLDHDPGDRIALDVSATPIGSSTVVTTTTVLPAPTVVYEPAVVYPPAPVYYDPYYYPGPSVVVTENYRHGGYYHH